ncbi:MAG: hypothetical protein WCX73_02935 [Candidatus Pacearchaeota archaeon]
MIMWILLVTVLIIRILARPFYFSILNSFVLFVYIISLISVIGKIKWGLLWTMGASLLSIFVFLIFNEGARYVLGLDIMLLILCVMGFFVEKSFN